MNSPVERPSPFDRENPPEIHGVVFEEMKRADGTVVGYKSSSPDRKAIELSRGSVHAPDLSRPYDVRVIEDTNPDDPRSGKLIVELMVDPKVDLSPEEWREAEQTLDQTEESMRRGRGASRELYRQIEIEREFRVGLTDEMIVKGSKQERVARKALEQEREADAEVELILGDKTSPMRLLAGFRSKNLSQAVRENRRIEKEREALLAEESQILSSAKGEPSGSTLVALDEVRGELKGLEKKREQLLGSSPEAYFGLHLKELKEYKRDLQDNKIVETPYVEEKAEETVAHIRAGKPVMLYGHLGSGKTEFAMHVARHYIGKDALVVSGSKHTSIAELYGHQVLAIDRIDKGELDTFAQEVENKFDAWKTEHADATEHEQIMAHDRILQTYLTQFKGGTISDFFLGPIYRAMEEGRPVIIDEVNAIPHEILISLNHILTRKPGEVVNVQQDSGKTVEVKEGYGVMMTGNLNQGDQKYIGRQDMDPAFLSRLHKIEYDYLPQKTEGSLKDEAGAENEQFHLLLARVMDRNGNIEIPEGSLSKLWNLAKAARVVQNVFAGKEINSAFYFQEAGGRATRYFLKESVLSIRALDGIISQWQGEGYRYELDHYIWKEFIEQSTNPIDRAYLFQLFQDRFGFFQGNGWEHPTYANIGTIASFAVADPENTVEKKEFFSPRDTVTKAFGNAPARARWPSAV